MVQNKAKQGKQEGCAPLTPRRPQTIIKSTQIQNFFQLKARPKSICKNGQNEIQKGAKMGKILTLEVQLQNQQLQGVKPHFQSSRSPPKAPQSNGGGVSVL